MKFKIEFTEKDCTVLLDGKGADLIEKLCITFDKAPELKNLLQNAIRIHDLGSMAKNENFFKEALESLKEVLRKKEEASSCEKAS